jgi:hypothetical protein
VPVQYGFDIVSLSRVFRIEQLDPESDECLVHVLLRYLAVHFCAHYKAEEEFVHHLDTVRYGTV